MRTLLSIRPERVVINPDESKVTHTVNGQVQQLIYLGDHIRCRMAVAGNDEFIVKIPNASDDLLLSMGDHVRVGWMTRNCRALNTD